jgi:hypothetical protein
MIAAALSALNAPVVMVKLAMVPPAGTLKVVGILTRPTAFSALDTPPVPAALFNVTVQVPVIFGPMTAGEHCIEMGNTGPTSERLALTVVPPAVAVTWATPSAAIAPAVAANVAVLDPAAAVTDAGTVTRGLSDAIVTTTPPVGAACDSVTVQVPPALPASALGAHCSAPGTVGGTGAVEMLVFADVPFNATLMVAVAGLDPTATLAVNVVELAPAGTVTMPGTVTLAPLEVTATPAPPAGAEDVKEIVHVLNPDEANTVGAQVTPVTVINVGALGFTRVIGTALPPPSAPIAELSATEPPVAGTLNVATVPAAITSGPRP